LVANRRWGSTERTWLINLGRFARRILNACARDNDLDELLPGYPKFVTLPIRSMTNEPSR
jgi:hypothetical protein